MRTGERAGARSSCFPVPTNPTRPADATVPPDGATRPGYHDDVPPGPATTSGDLPSRLDRIDAELRALKAETQTALAETRAAAAEVRAFSTEVRAERATFDAYRAELAGWRTETNTRFNSIDDALQNLYQLFVDHTHPPEET